MSAEIVFADEKLKKTFDNLKNSKTEDKQLYELLKRAFEDIEKNPSGFIHVPNSLIPKEYVSKYGINNLWKYDLPGGWRLFYTVAPPDSPGKVIVLSIVLDWMSHKEYERLFRY